MDNYNIDYHGLHDPNNTLAAGASWMDVSIADISGGLWTSNIEYDTNTYVNVGSLAYVLENRSIPNVRYL